MEQFVKKGTMDIDVVGMALSAYHNSNVSAGWSDASRVQGNLTEYEQQIQEIRRYVFFSLVEQRNTSRTPSLFLMGD